MFVVVVLWRPFKTPVCPSKTSPCVRPRRPVYAGTTRTCYNVRARGAGTHGDVLNVHTEAFLNPHTGVLQRFTPQHKTQHTRHTTTTTTTRGDLERRRRKRRQRKRERREDEREEKTREDERRDERGEKMKDERNGKRRTLGADDNFTDGAELSY